MDEEELEILEKTIRSGRNKSVKANSWRIIVVGIIIIIIIIIILILSKMPVNTIGHSNHAFYCDIFYHLFSWSSGQSFWLLIVRSRVRFPALPWGFFLEGEDSHGDHSLGS
jgi:hypothetical protein